MHSHIITDNRTIRHKNIYQVLKHTFVVPQHVFSGKYYKLSWRDVDIWKIIIFCPTDDMAKYHPSCNGTTIICYENIYQS